MKAVGIPSELMVNVCKPAGVVGDCDMADRDVPAGRTGERGREEREELKSDLCHGSSLPSGCIVAYIVPFNIPTNLYQRLLPGELW